jgi:hypothetical protein
METITRRKVAILVLTALMTTGAVFAAASASTSAVGDAQAKQKTVTVQQKQMLDDVMCCQS